MPPALSLLTSATEIINVASLVNGFILFALAAFATWYWKTYDARAVTRKTELADRLQWRQARLDAEKTLSESITSFQQQQQLSDLKYQADMARIGDIFQRFVQVSDGLTTITEQTKWHGKELDRHEEEFRKIHRHLEGIQQDIKENMPRHD